MKYWLIGIIVVLLLAAVAFMIVKKVSPVGWGWWGTTNTSSGVALGGYDPVSYFEAGEPLQGQNDFRYRWRDAEWHFTSAENRDRFAADPGRYAPQFGGFCAFAVSKGFTADSTPAAWHIEDGGLYVFADGKVRDEWVAMIGEGSLERSRTNWAKRQSR
jgi:hypothetical protein